MIRIIRSSERHHRNSGWLDARWHFSFSDYYDPENRNWGPLRVFNDDMIAGGGGFDPHPHRDMEIISYIVSGALRHTDSMGNDHVSSRGGVQVMSAGRGIVHSEYNASDTDPVRLLQIWILPRRRGQTPRWAQKSFERELQSGQWTPVVSDGSVVGTLAVDQDALLLAARPLAGSTLRHSVRPGRRAYAFVVEGKIDLNGQRLSAGDQARIVDETELQIETPVDSELVLLDLPS
ncbi:MAG: pirin family protein [Phycisphaerae bacterium]|nr:pirin family protein [Phycisphaerae bacterium]MDW8262314.1 pirin family protein [Phycisphaerales bacterium]